MSNIPRHLINKKLSLTLAISVAMGLTACGGGSATTPSAITVGGGGTKGPLIGAVVSAYKVDPAAADLKGALIDTGETGADAKITGLTLPSPLEDAYLIVFRVRDDAEALVDGETTDLTTGVAPVITKMRTIVSQATIQSSNVYGTPLTDLAVGITAARINHATASVSDVLDDLGKAAKEVVSTVGFGMDVDTDIFSASPVIDEDTSDLEATASYRAAIEAIAAVVYQAAEDSADAGDDADGALAALASDLSDGEIDGDGGAASAEVLAVLEAVQEDGVASLPIPNGEEGDTVGTVGEILKEEATTTGGEEPAAAPEVVVSAPVLDLDSDGDGTNDADEDDNDGDGYSNDVETAEGTDIDDATSTPVDTDGDFNPDSTDFDDDNDNFTDVVETTEGTDPLDATSVPSDNDGDYILDSADTDDDNDGYSDTVEDSEGTDPLLDTSTPADNDGDFDPDSTDPDDDNDGVLDADDAFPEDAGESVDTDADGTGNNADTDDDGDGYSDAVESAESSDPLDQASKPADNDGDFDPDSTDPDDDNDTVLDTDDAFPKDEDEFVDTDADGTGNNADTDDDGDGYPDALEITAGTDPLDSTDKPQDADLDGIPNSTDPDDDNDGVLDGDDKFPFDKDESVDTDNDGTGNNADTDDDGDGYSDTIEGIENTDPLSASSKPVDNDGDFDPDSTDPDIDGDGVLNGVDAFPFDETESLDPDSDGIGSNTDNCPAIANVGQEDADHDGVGDACIPEVAQAKQLVSDARTWITAIDNLGTPVEAFAIDAETLKTSLGNASGVVMQTSVMVIAQVMTAIRNEPQSSSTSFSMPSSVNIYDDLGLSVVGTVTVTNTSTASIFSAQITGTVDGVRVDFISSIDRSEAVILAAIDSGTYDPKGESFVLALSGTAQDDLAKIELANGTLGIGVAQDLNAVGDFEPTAFNLTGGLTVSELSGGSPTGAKMSGAVEVVFIELPVSERRSTESAPISLQRMAFTDLAITDATGSKTGLSLELDVTDAGTTDTIAIISSQDEIFVWEQSAGDAYGVGALARAKFPELSSVTSFSACYGPDCTFYGTYIGANQVCVNYQSSTISLNECRVADIGDFLPSIQQNYPLAVGYDLRQIYYNGFESYLNTYVYFPDAETAGDYLKATITLSGVIDLDGHPAANATLVLDKTGLNSGTGTLNLSFDGSSLDIEASNPTGTGEGTITVTNGTGVELIITVSAGDTTGTVTVGGHVVGTIANGIITYNDGTFESL